MAEVLITLTIVGLVATLTIPTLVQSYKKQIASTRLKKFYSTMVQAIRLSEIENGPSLKWGSGRGDDIKDVEGNYDYDANSQAAYDFL